MCSPLVTTQVCGDSSDKSNEAPLRSLLLAAEPWSRRRPIAVACYSGTWHE